MSRLATWGSTVLLVTQGATVQGTAVRVDTILHMYSQMMMRSTHTAVSLVVSSEGSI